MNEEQSQDQRRKRRRRGRRGRGGGAPQAGDAAQAPASPPAGPQRQRVDNRRASRERQGLGPAPAPASGRIRRPPRPEQRDDRRPREDRRPRQDDLPRREARPSRERERDYGRPHRIGLTPEQAAAERIRAMEMTAPQDEQSLELGAAFKEAQAALRDARKALDKRRAESGDEPEWLLEQYAAAEQRFEEAATAWSEHLATTGRKRVPAQRR